MAKSAQITRALTLMEQATKFADQSTKIENVSDGEILRAIACLTMATAGGVAVLLEERQKQLRGETT